MWCNPLPLQLVPITVDAYEPLLGQTFLPLGAHPGAWGVQRKNHVHEGIDLYAPVGMAVYAVEAGQVTGVIDFTGPIAGSPWWLDTKAVWVEGASGAVLYGEIVPSVSVGAVLAPGDLIGHVARVLRRDKGRPVSMLHLELHAPGTVVAPEWVNPEKKPETLRDPTPFLLGAIPNVIND